MRVSRLNDNKVITCIIQEIIHTWYINTYKKYIHTNIQILSMLIQSHIHTQFKLKLKNNAFPKSNLFDNILSGLILFIVQLNGFFPAEFVLRNLA